VSSPLASLDFVIVGAYFALVFLVAWYATWKDRQKVETLSASADYFLAGRHTPWFVIGASLFASNIGSEHLIGLSGSGARGDLAAAQFEMLAVLILILLGWVFAPFYIRSGVFTMPEFLEKRFTPKARNYLAIISILSYVLTKISVTIFAGALVFEELLGVDFWTGAIVVVVATGLYTVLGGLRAVIYTDLVQMFVLVGGSIALIYFGLDAVGGWDAAVEAIRVAESENNTWLNLWRAADDPDYPWVGIMFGAPIIGVWYWCTDQFIVQRVLSASDEQGARRGALFGSALKLTPIFLFLIPGVIAYSIFLEADPTLLLGPESGEVDFDRAMPAMVSNVLPVGIKGLVTAGLLAALMSSLSSVFNSCSTLLTIDFYKRRTPEATDADLVKFGRYATGVLVVIGLLWIPLMKGLQEEGGLFKYLQEVQAYISPPIAAVFLLGLFFPQLNGKGAMASLWTGFVLGIGKLFAVFLTDGHAEGEAIINSGILVSFAEINFLMYALYLFIICTVVLFAASSTGQSKSLDELQGMIFKSGSLHKSSVDTAITVLLIIAVIVIWIVFSPLGIA
jgi:SSS family solute:Na+ symporter